MFAVTRLAWLLVLLACAPRPEVPAASGPRDLSSQVYSIAGFDPARLAGDWVQVAGFGAGCSGGRLSMEAGLDYDLCLASGRASGRAEATQVPGRFDSKDGALWVLWADADNRTLVIGGPDGRMGAVLNRAGGISADRLQAARDILAFNGYDLSRLRAY